MLQFKNFQYSFPFINTEQQLEDSFYSYVLDLLGDINFSDLFYLDCNKNEDENFEALSLIETNGEFIEDCDDLQLYNFDDKKIAIYNSFGDAYVFCQRKDVEDLSGIF